ncbi:MAG TPA: cupin domain-containing protein [Vicinamibacterales bacterium]
MRRRTFLGSVAGWSALVLPQQPPAPVHGDGVVVRHDADRFGETRRLPAGNPMWVKVSTRDTGGAFFLMEQTNTERRGPARHYHFDVDEWFYCLAGRYVVEVGGQRHTLEPGDSILAPRLVPHAFAFAGEGTGRLLVGFTPAGRMEEFFRELERRGSFFGTGTDADRARLREFGMENVGPPLEL